MGQLNSILSLIFGPNKYLVYELNCLLSLYITPNKEMVMDDTKTLYRFDNASLQT